MPSNELTRRAEAAAAGWVASGADHDAAVACCRDRLEAELQPDEAHLRKLAGLAPKLTDQEMAEQAERANRKAPPPFRFIHLNRRSGRIVGVHRWEPRRKRIVEAQVIGPRRPLPARPGRREIHSRPARANAPPAEDDSEPDLASLRPGVRAVAVYRRLLRDGRRPLAEVWAALDAANITPDSGTDKRARRVLGIVSAPDGWQGPHWVEIPAEPHLPLIDGRVVTHSRRGDTPADHKRRHDENIEWAEKVHRMRARVTGWPMVAA